MDENEKGITWYIVIMVISIIGCGFGVWVTILIIKALLKYLGS